MTHFDSVPESDATSEGTPANEMTLGGRASLRGNYGKLLASSAAGNLADGIFKFALPVLAVKLSGNAIVVAGVTGMLSLPWLLASLPAGAFADRIDRLKTMVRVNAARTLVLTALAFILWADMESIAIVYAVAFTLGLAEVIFDISAQALLPSLVPDERLGSANAALMTIEFSMNQLIGKAIGGWLAGAAVYLAFGTAAACYFLGSVALALIIGEFRAKRETADTPIRTDIAEGVRFLWNHTVLRNLAISISLVEFFYEGVFAILPLFALATRNGPLELTAFEYGVLIATMSIGGLIGSIASGWIEKHVHPITVNVVCLLSVTAQLAALTFTINIWVIAGTTAVTGAAALIFTVISVTMRQRLIPDELLGRVNSCYRLAVFGAMSIGAFAAGIIAQATSMHFFFGISAVVVTCVAVFMVSLRKPYDSAIAAR